MRKLFANLMTLAVVAMACVSCEKTTIDNNSTHTSGTVLYVTDLSSRIGFEDKDTEGIDLTWEIEDTFTVFNSEGARVGDFKCTDTQNNTFTSETTLTEDAYTAFYPATKAKTLSEAKKAIDPSVQNGDEIADLDNACYMLADFTYSNSKASSITFVHQMAIMTITFAEEASHAPLRLDFTNDSQLYSVKFENLKAVNGFYTTHIMINSCKAVNRPLIVSIYDTNNELYSRHIKFSQKEYRTGMRYIASLPSFDTPARYSGGSGTEQDPYLMSNGADMSELHYDMFNINNTYDDHFIMTNDINLGGIDEDGNCVEDKALKYIGSNNMPFTGTFDGKNLEIKGLYIPATNNKSGIFNETKNATIKNLTVSGSVGGTSDVSGIVSTATSTNITNCHSKVNLTSSGNCYVGGIVAISISSHILDCSNTGTIKSSTASNVGGIVGRTNTSTTITNCYNAGTIECSSCSNTGGIVGNSFENTSITNCYNKGKVEGRTMVGGIAGEISNSYITHCYNTEKVQGNKDYVGGVVGKYNYASISYCYNTASVESSGLYVGGVAGYTKNYSNCITNCYNTGNVSGAKGTGGVVGYTFSNEKSYITNCYNTGEISSSDTFVGGIVGYAKLTNVRNCYSTSKVNTTSASGKIGGVAGQAYYSNIITKCYWANDVTGAKYGIGAASQAPKDPTNVGAEPMSTINLLELGFSTTLNEEATEYNKTVPTIIINYTGGVREITVEACQWKKEAGKFPTLIFPSVESVTPAN